MTQFAGVKYTFDKDLNIKQTGDNLEVSFNSFKKTFFGVENRFAPGFENKPKTFSDYLTTLRTVMKDKISIEEEGEFSNLYKKKNKNKEEENNLSDIS